MAPAIGKAGPPADLRKFMEKRLDVSLNGNRRVVGVLRGYDNFMNIVLDNAIEVISQQNLAGQSAAIMKKSEIGMIVIRGNSILSWECLDKIATAAPAVPGAK